jgi:hypothetical protein
MSRNETWTNQDGLEVGFGTRDSLNIEDSQVHTLGREKQAEIVITAENAGSFVDGVVPTGKEFQLPAGSSVQSVQVETVVAFDVTTSITLGTRDATTGVSIDTEAYMDAVDGVAANMAVVGDMIFSSTGNDILAAQVTAVDSILELVQAGGDATDGELRVLIRYVEGSVAQDSPAIIVGEI